MSVDYLYSPRPGLRSQSRVDQIRLVIPKPLRASDGESHSASFILRLPWARQKLYSPRITNSSNRGTGGIQVVEEFFVVIAMSGVMAPNGRLVTLLADALRRRLREEAGNGVEPRPLSKSWSFRFEPRRSCSGYRWHRARRSGPGATAAPMSVWPPQSEMPGVPACAGDGPWQSPLGCSCWCAHWHCVRRRVA